MAKRRSEGLRLMRQSPRAAGPALSAGSPQIQGPSIFGRADVHDAYSQDMPTILDLLHPEDLPQVQQAMHRVLGQQREWQLECRLRDQSSGYSTVAMRLVFNEAVSWRAAHVCRDPRHFRPGGPASGRTVIERLKAATRARTDRELAAFLNVSAAAISNAHRKRTRSRGLVSPGRTAHRPFHRLARIRPGAARIRG